MTHPTFTTILAQANALHVPQITATIREPNDRLHAIVFAERALTEEEWAFLRACEQSGEGE